MQNDNINVMPTVSNLGVEDSPMTGPDAAVVIPVKAPSDPEKNAHQPIFKQNSSLKKSGDPVNKKKKGMLKVVSFIEED